jgi:hypothetical protein
MLQFFHDPRRPPIPLSKGESFMSHIVTIATKVQDPVAVLAACQRLNLPEPVHATATLFSGEATGLLVKLRDWVYPVVVDTATGQVAYDNFEGSWGDPKLLDRFLQMYAVENSTAPQCTPC